MNFGVDKSLCRVFPTDHFVRKKRNAFPPNLVYGIGGNAVISSQNTFLLIQTLHKLLYRLSCEEEERNFKNHGGGNAVTSSQNTFLLIQTLHKLLYRLRCEEEERNFKNHGGGNDVISSQNDFLLIKRLALMPKKSFSKLVAKTLQTIRKNSRDEIFLTINGSPDVEPFENVEIPDDVFRKHDLGKGDLDTLVRGFCYSWNQQGMLMKDKATKWDNGLGEEAGSKRYIFAARYVDTDGDGVANEIHYQLMGFYGKLGHVDLRCAIVNQKVDAVLVVNEKCTDTDLIEHFTVENISKGMSTEMQNRDVYGDTGLGTRAQGLTYRNSLKGCDLQKIREHAFTCFTGCTVPIYRARFTAPGNLSPDLPRPVLNVHISTPFHIAYLISSCNSLQRCLHKQCIFPPSTTAVFHRPVINNPSLGWTFRNHLEYGTLLLLSRNLATSAPAQTPIEVPLKLLLRNRNPDHASCAVP
eukprot:g48267.t1